MDKLLNVKDMMKSLNCGKTKMYEMINEGILPVIKIGNRYFISEKRLDKWIENSAGNCY